MTINEVVSACQLCASCCYGAKVIVTGKDISRIQSETNKLPKEFSANGVLLSKDDGSCVFLKQSGGAYGCGIYKSRPKPCKDFPTDEAYTAVCTPALGEVSRH